MKNRKFIVFLSLVFIVTSFCTVKTYAAVSSSRLYGQNRYETSSKIAEYYNSNTVNNVILVYGEDFPDALSASVLAYKLNAPILLVNSAVEGSSDAFDYIVKHLDKSGNVYIIGSAAAAGGDFSSYLNQMGYKNIIEIGNSDRYYTNYMVARELNVPQNTPVVISSGENYPDALGISSFAAYNNWPVLLVPNDTLPDKTSQFLLSDKPSKIYITGGTGVITSKVEEQVQKLVPDAKIVRFAGKDRFDTNARIIQAFGSEPKNIYLASGYGFADALSGSVLAARTGDPIILVDPSAATVPAPAAPFLYNYKNKFQNVISFGGTAVVPESIASSVSSMPLSNIATSIPADDTEILRAISYGFVPDGLQGAWDKTVTFSQFCTMVKNMLPLYDNKLVPEWEKTVSKASASNDIMHRDHGMLAVYYAACLMGIGQTTNGNWNYMAQNIGVETVNGFDNNYEKWFPDCSKQAPFYDIAYKKRISGWDFVTSSRFFCLGQTSCVSGNQVFDIDFGNKTMKLMDNFTRKDAIHAVLRLYESTLTPADKTIGSNEKSSEILTLADNRRNSIINSSTAITKSDTFIQGKTYTGTAYYVSNSGSDANNGMSPETPWATMNKVNSADLKHGDAVFFKRGDIWYDQLWEQAGVTYSAYGTGSKPTINGSVKENAAALDKWKLYYEGNNGEKIWVYYRDLPDSSGVFFDGGQSWANKVTPRWDGKQYVFDTGKSFDAVTGLTQDLDYFSCLDLTKIKPLEKVNETGAAGPLYLRCDGGNPGEIYNNIEFALDGIGVGPAGENGRDITVDNLKVVYFASLGVDCRGYLGFTNTIVQNCEIGWCGGGITNYSYDLGDKFAVANISGGAIQMSGPQNTAVNNYIHHCASKALVVALHDRTSASNIYSDIVIKGNLLEYNSAALHLVNYMEQENPSADSGFKNVSFDDNYIMFTGYGWVDTKTQRTDFWLERLPFSSIEFGGYNENKNDGIFITNNIFYLSKYVLVHCYMPKDNQPAFSGNTYAQSENGWISMLRGRLLSITQNGGQYVRDDLLDKTGTVLTVK